MAIVLDGTNGITSPGGDTSSTSHTTPILKSASSLTFQTNGTTTALAIGTTGELSIGSFSQSNNDPAVIKGIEMGAAGNLVYGTGGSQSGLMTNLYYNGGWKVAQTGNAASMYYQLDGQHTFTGTTYATSAGTAGDAASVTTLVSFTKDKSLALQGASTQTGTGITFPATQSASSNANTLDDYEEGTWTPVLKLGATSQTITGGNARYIKVGNVVNFVAELYFTKSGTGDFNVSALPFTAAASRQCNVNYYFQFYTTSMPSTDKLTYIESSGTAFTPQYMPAGGTQTANINDTHFTGSTNYFYFAGSYIVV